MTNADLDISSEEVFRKSHSTLKIELYNLELKDCILKYPDASVMPRPDDMNLSRAVFLSLFEDLAKSQSVHGHPGAIHMGKLLL